MYVGPWQEYQLSKAKHNALAQLQAALQSAASSTISQSNSYSRTRKRHPVNQKLGAEAQPYVLTRNQVQQTLRTLPLDTLQTLLPMLIPAKTIPQELQKSHTSSKASGTSQTQLLREVAQHMREPGETRQERRERLLKKTSQHLPAQGFTKKHPQGALKSSKPQGNYEYRAVLGTLKQGQDDNVEDPLPARKTGFWKSAKMSLNTSLYHKSGRRHESIKSPRQSLRQQQQDSNIPKWMQRRTQATGKYVSAKIREQMRKEHSRGPSSLSSVSTNTSAVTEKNPSRFTQDNHSKGCKKTLSGKDEIERMRKVYLRGVQNEKVSEQTDTDSHSKNEGRTHSSGGHSQQASTPERQRSSHSENSVSQYQASSVDKKDPPSPSNSESTSHYQSLKVGGDQTTKALISLLEKQMQKQAELTNQLHEQAKVQEQMREQIASLLAAQMHQGMNSQTTAISSTKTSYKSEAEGREYDQSNNEADPGGGDSNSGTLIDVSAALKLFGMSDTSVGQDYNKKRQNKEGEQGLEDKIGQQLRREMAGISAPHKGTSTLPVSEYPQYSSSSTSGDHASGSTSVSPTDSALNSTCAPSSATSVPSESTQHFPNASKTNNIKGPKTGDTTGTCHRYVESPSESNNQTKTDVADSEAVSRGNNSHMVSSASSSVRSDQLRFHIVHSACSSQNRGKSPRESTVDVTGTDKEEVDELLKWVEELDV